MTSDAPYSDPRLLAEETPGDNAPPMSVSEISALLKRTVEDRFGHIRLRGEISGFKRAASGHCYMALKDDSAVIDAVMWRGNAGRIAFKPEDGLEVVVTGRLTTYPGRSKYQIVIESMELAGEGALMALLDKLRRKLAAEGLFDADRKQRLPALPRTIGVVTSPTGAVIRDILHRLADRFPSHVIIWPVAVQGAGSAEQVAAAIRGFNALGRDAPVTRPDLLIVARGGGSIEDLWSFNEEIVVRAVAESGIPVISAVGHETDTSLCDHAADMRAPTPTAAAELAVPVLADLKLRVEENSLRMAQGVRRHHALAQERLTACARLLPRLDQLMQPQAQRLDDLAERAQSAIRISLSQAETALFRDSGALRPALLRRVWERAEHALGRVRFDKDHLAGRLERASAQLGQLARVLPQLDPKMPLERGFALVRDGAGNIVSTADEAAQNAALVLEFRDEQRLDVYTGKPRTGTRKPPPVKPGEQQELF